MALRPPRAGIGVSRRLSERDRQRRAAAADTSRTDHARTDQAGADQAGAETARVETAGAGVLGGMMEALQGLVAQLAKSAEAARDMSQTDQSDAAGASTIRRGFGVGQGGSRAVFGYTLRMGLDGVRAEPFGDVPDGPAARPAAPEPPARQPIVEVFEEPGAVVVIAELPGADPAALSCQVEGEALLVEAGGARRYRKRVALPVPVRPDALRQSFQNGILEVRLVPA